MELRQRVWDFCERHELLAPGDAVLAAVSGGPDSLCMLDILHRLAPAHRLRLIVAHLNHGLRAAAASEAQFVQAEAEARGLRCIVDHVDTPEYAQTHGLGLEESARRLRYAFLAQAAQAARAARIAVAHTADDQAETVLMHLLRGSGLAGLKGMAAKLTLTEWGPAPDGSTGGRDASTLPAPPAVCIVRPMLGTTRAAVEAYCAEHGLTPRHDATNRDTQYFRNWVRHTALPLLETRNPNLRVTLARTAEVLAGEHALAEAAVGAAWERAAPAGWQSPSQVVFTLAEWRALPLPLVRGLLRRAVVVLRGGLRDVDFAPLDAVARFSLGAAAGRSCEAPGGLRLTVLPDRLVLSEVVPSQLPPGPQLDTAGQLADGWRLEVSRLEPGQWTWSEVRTAGAWEVYVDAAHVTHPLAVRARQAGERFHPLGLGGHSAKVSDYMVNNKVPAAWRARWPVVVSGADVVWLAGLRLDERFRVRPDTAAVLRLAFSQDGIGDL